MTSRKLFASLLVACVLAAGIHGSVPRANAASVGLHFLKAGESARNNVIEIKGRGRGRGPGPYLPIVPYIAYDYPYYYSRGHYPTSIGPGYLYYGRPYSYYVRSYNARHGRRCSNGSRRCLAKWGRDRTSGSPRRRPY
jgi:hypothetical protein